jgi:ribosomal protein uS19
LFFVFASSSLFFFIFFPLFLFSLSFPSFFFFQADKGKKDAKAAPAKKDDKKPEAKKDDKKAEAKKDDKKAEVKKDAPKTAEVKKDAPKQTDEKGGEDSRVPFRRFFFKGIEVNKLLDLTHGELMALMTSRARRRFRRGNVPMHLIRKLRNAKKNATDEKAKVIKTHFRNMIIVPEMVGSTIGVYTGLNFTQVEIKVCFPP